MAVVINGIIKGSAAEKLGIKPGDILLEIDGNEISDVFDYGFYSADGGMTLLISRGNNETEEFNISFEEETSDPGLIFNDFLMDERRRCGNKCIFCFVDQLPSGMRENLYFKDDDERLSFLFGNYLSMTNLSERLVQRIISMRLSPVNISVHTTDPELRCYMMGNKRAGESLKYIRRFVGANIEVNCQIVLCRGINDGAALDRTLRDLAEFFPALGSVSVVPVGLTSHREGLAKLEVYDEKSAAAILDRIEAFGKKFRETNGKGFTYPADEWYVLTGRRLPDIEFYDQFPQLENGVGMLTLFESEFLGALGSCSRLKTVPADIITGKAAEGWMISLIEKAKKKFPAIKAATHAVDNEFFGGNINVAGLLTGGDIIKQVSPLSLEGEVMLISKNMLRSEGDLFLDGVSVKDISVCYNRRVKVISDGYELFDALKR